MTSREIIIKLVDQKLINGEEAAILFNDIFQSEILESWKALNNKGLNDLVKFNDMWTTPSSIATWTDGSNICASTTNSNVTGI